MCRLVQRNIDIVDTSSIFRIFTKVLDTWLFFESLLFLEGFTKCSKKAPAKKVPVDKVDEHHNNITTVPKTKSFMTNNASKPARKRSREQVERELKTAAIAEENAEEHEQRQKKLVANKPLSFLRDQLSPEILKVNRANKALKFQKITEKVWREEYHRRRAAGESIPVPEKIAFKIDDELIGEIEIVKCGGKGQYMRVVHPPTPAQPEQ